MRRILCTAMLLAGALGLQAADLPPDLPAHRKARAALVREHIEDQGIDAASVLAAMRAVPRHFFVPQDLIPSAYRDRPLPIGEGQTISQPYIVALMTASLDLTPASRVLEVGTGSGYQAAVLSKVAGEVYTIEIKQELYQAAAERLSAMDLTNVHTRPGDGYFGWPQAAPFDAIMITAAVDHIPPPLIKQLKNGGRLILPLGNPFSYQNLVLATKKNDDVFVRQITGVLFVPLTGYALEKKGD